MRIPSDAGSSVSSGPRQQRTRAAASARPLERRAALLAPSHQLGRREGLVPPRSDQRTAELRAGIARGRRPSRFALLQQQAGEQGRQQRGVLSKSASTSAGARPSATLHSLSVAIVHHSLLARVSAPELSDRSASVARISVSIRVVTRLDARLSRERGS